jgi:hypothetical protein
MLDEDELNAEMSMFRAPHPVAPKKKRFSDYANEQDYDDPPPPSRFSSSSGKKKTTFLIEEEDDDPPPSRQQKNSWRQQQQPSDNVKAIGPVPYRLQEAASLLLENRRLSRHVAEELTMAYLQRPHEFVTVDPLVLVCASVDTGTVRIYCKEVVNVSVHWMALALDAKFFLQITPKARTQDEPWAETITVRPCRSAQVSERVQPVGTLKAVQRAMEALEEALPPTLDQRVEHYMTTVVGVVDSATVCDPEFAREHVEAFRAMCRGGGLEQTESLGIREKLKKMKSAASE